MLESRADPATYSMGADPPVCPGFTLSRAVPISLLGASRFGHAGTREGMHSQIQAYMHCAFCGTRHSARSAERSDARCSECRCPLHAVSPIEPSGDAPAGRAVERFERRLAVQLEQSWPAEASIAATSEDLSIHGMRLVVPTELWVGACVRIACDFCDAVGEVSNVQAAPDAGPSAWRVGIRFLTICVRQPRGSLVSLKG